MVRSFKPPHCVAAGLFGLAALLAPAGAEATPVREPALCAAPAVSVSRSVDALQCRTAARRIHRLVGARSVPDLADLRGLPPRHYVGLLILGVSY